MKLVHPEVLLLCAQMKANCPSHKAFHQPRTSIPVDCGVYLFWPVSVSLKCSTQCASLLCQEQAHPQEHDRMNSGCYQSWQTFMSPFNGAEGLHNYQHGTGWKLHGLLSSLTCEVPTPRDINTIQRWCTKTAVPPLNWMVITDTVKVLISSYPQSHLLWTKVEVSWQM